MCILKTAQAPEIQCQWQIFLLRHPENVFGSLSPPFKKSFESFLEEVESHALRRIKPINAYLIPVD